VVVTVLQGLLTGLAFVAFGVPAWIFAIAVRHGTRRRRPTEPSGRYFAYSRLIGYIHDEMKTGKVECGPRWVAAVRELREYPEFADISVLFLEEITITGGKKFDRVMEKELRDVESYLLEQRHV
jgi:hypothetical protein